MTFFIITLVACMFILFNEKYRGLSIFGIVFTTCAMLIFVSTILFKLEVENNYFRIRTKFGKKFEFNLSEIERVCCIETMAKYLLKKYKNGEMYDDAISDYNKEQLKIYSDKKKREM